MLIVISIALLVGAFLFSSSKKYSLLMMIYMWILFALNTLNGDFISYEKIYNHIIYGNKEVISNYEEGFVLICKIGGKLGLNYQEFLIIPATICTILFCVVIRLYANDGYQNIFIALFIIFSYWMMICQYRTYIGILLTLIGLYFLYKYDDFKGYLIFILFVLLGVLFHRMVFLYLIYLPAKKWKTRTLVLFLPIIAAIVLLIRNPTFSRTIARYVAGYKMVRWLYTDNQRSVLAILALLVLRLGVVVFEIYMTYNTNNAKISWSHYDIQQFILNISIISLGFLPLEFMIKDFERLSRIPLILLFIFILNYGKDNDINIHKVPLSVISVGNFLVVYMIFYYISFSGWFEHNLIPILTNNLLLGT